jgi:hypothetical protein
MKRCLSCSVKFEPKRSDALYCSVNCRVNYNRSKRSNPVTDNSSKIILSLCDYSGNWSLPYAAAGYSVQQVDLKGSISQDIRLMKFPGKVYGILAAPPCTVFSIAGNRWQRTEAEMLEGLSIVDACFRIIAICKPTFWALENPTGKLKSYLGEPTWYFNPCDYGDPYTKKTCLWGKFNVPKPNLVEPTERGKIANMRGGLEKRKELRSITPLGFAKAFFEANL